MFEYILYGLAGFFGLQRPFSVSRTVEIESLTLTKGKETNGGAISVTENGNLTLRACAIMESEAANWGGAVDVAEGALTVDGCLFKNNRTSSSLGLGGGAVSIYTSLPCSITNTTFSGNTQGSNTGFGGGAVYAEAFSAAIGLDLNLSHCTFAGNSDMASAGTSLQANVFGTAAVMKNCIVADSNGGNLEVVGAAIIRSDGGNLSDDQTRSDLVQGGAPQSIYHFDQASDQTLIDPQLGSLSMSVGSLAAHAISANSPAVGSAVTVAAAVDGRAALRSDGDPDSGAFEAGAPQLLVLNEIGYATATPFLEFYSPRNTTPLDLNGTSLWVDGTLILTFSGLAEIQPGFGVLVANGALTGNGTPVVQAPAMALNARGLIELRSADSGIVLSVTYNGKFTSPTDPASDYILGATSITLAPQFVGSAYVPHTMVQSPDLPGMNGVDPTAPGDAESPGRDTGNKRFGASNSLPNAVADNFELTEDQMGVFDLLVNDSDADGSDKLVIVDVNGAAVASSVEGAALVLSPANNGTPTTPHRGLVIDYDPRGSAGLQSLPVGTERVDTFQYTIVDITTGTANSFSEDPGNANVTIVHTPAHRLLDGVEIKIAGSGNYSGTHPISLIPLGPDTEPGKFTIPVPFAGAASAVAWEAVESRPLGAGADDTQRDTATVTVTVLGANDAPIPVADTVTTPEETILRIMGDSALAGTTTIFDTDPNYPQPRTISNESLLIDDGDPDTDDDGESLKLVGVVGCVTAVGAYAQAPGPIGVTVTSTGHGLTTGDSVLIAGYGGHPSYNAVHAVTVVDSNRFTIPIIYVDNHTTTGVWTEYAPGAQLNAVSEHEASVTLEIRADRRETNIVYNPRPSVYLDGIAMGDTENDSFYYVVVDSHGARGLAKITVAVTGVNDDPVPGIDPDTLVALGLPDDDLSALADALGKLGTAYLLPSSDGDPARVLVGLVDPSNPGAGAIVVDQFWTTNEETPLILNIDPAASGPLDPLGNDFDIDRGDILTINTPGAVLTSREGASVTVSADGRSLIYDPSVSLKLNALARDERLIDTVIVTVNDSHGPGVESLIAIFVTGLNDSPRTDVLPPLTLTAPEDELTIFDAPGVLADDVEPDENVTLPDNRKIIVPATGLTTTVPNVVYSTTAAGATGAVTGFAAVGLNPMLTLVSAPGHPLNPGEEVVISGTGEVPYEGQFVVVASNANTFTVAVSFVPGSENTTGQWTSVRSQVHYDPRGSLFDYQNPSTFALDGLAVGQIYIDTISYEIFDGSYVFAMDDIFKITANGEAADLDVLANDSNLTGITTQMNLVSVSLTSEGGTVAVVGGMARYTPPANFVGDEVFTYIAEDELGNRDAAQVVVRATVEPLNGNLQANNDVFTVALGQSPVLPVLANDDILPDGAGILSITDIVTPPTKGTATVLANGIRYVPNAAVSGMDSFQYELSGGGTARAVATVDIEIVDRENALFTRADAFSVTIGSVENALDVLANDNILPGNGLVLSVSSNVLPANGTLGVNAGGNGFLYTPAAGFTGVDTFSYIADDSYGGTGIATATVTVGSLVTNSDFFVVPAGTIDTPLLVLENDTVLGSPAGNVVLSGISATAAGAPVATLSLGALGDLQLVGGEIQFTAIATAGEASFFYTITDPSNRTAVGMATVAVVTDGVTANTDYFSVLTGSGPTDLNVLENDVSVPLRPMGIVSIGTGLNAPNQGGSAQIVTTPSGVRIRYQPASAFVGEEIFTYTVSDSIRTDTATVIMRVGLGDLYANPDTYTVYYQLGASPPNSFILPVLVNDLVLPANGETLTITGVGIDHTGDPNAPNLDGSVVISGDGTTLTYTPAEDAALVVGSPPFVESFTYVISDGTDRRAEAQVQVEVHVRDESRDMDTNNDTFTIASDSLANVLDVLANDSVKPAPALGWTITGVSAPTPIPVGTQNGGTASVANGAILYSPAAGFVGRVTMTYNVSDGLGGTGSASVIVKIGDVRVSDDYFAVLAESVDNVFDVLTNDGVFPVAPPLNGYVLDSVNALVPNQGGSAIVVNGMIEYQPSAGYVGIETFEYRVLDDSGNSYPGEVTISVQPLGIDRATGTAEIIVTGVNDPPVIVGPTTFTITDKQILYPFAGATLIDVDDQGQEKISLSLELDDATKGNLFHPGGLFSWVGNAYVSAPMSPVDATEALRGVQLQPTPDRQTSPDGDEMLTVSISIDDGHVVVTNEDTVVTVQHPPMSKILPVVTGTMVDDSTLSAAFGSAVSVSGDTMVVGSPGRDSPQTDSGAVFIYRRMRLDGVERWEQTKLIVASDGAASDRFGASVALDGDTLVVGSPFDDTAGAAYVFSRNAGGAGNWGQVKKLVVEPVLRLAGDQFGIDVDVDGDTVIVGAAYADRVAVDSGMARIYERNLGGAGNFGLLQEITQMDPVFLDWFGVSVAVSDDTLIVGAYGDNRAQDAANFDLGAAYIFERTGPPAAPWLETKKLERFADPRATRDDYFGWAVDISGDTAIVGAYLLDAVPGAVNSGAAFLYERNTGGVNNWGELLEIRSATPLVGEQFGYSVSIDQNMALVGTNSQSVTTPAGFVQCYVRDLGTHNWRFTDTLLPPVLSTRGGFGFSVAIDKGAVVVGSPYDSDNPSGEINGGAVYAAQLQLENPGAFDLFARAWQIANFTSVTVQDLSARSMVWGLDANPDGDAFSNAIEMLRGSDPNQPDPGEPFNLVSHPGGGCSMLYVRLKSFPVEFVRPAWSTDLLNWNHGDFIETVEADLGNTELIRVNFVDLLTPPFPPFFCLRLEIGRR